MTKTISDRVRSWLAPWALCSVALAQAAGEGPTAAVPPADAFTRLPAMSSVRPSPSGKRLAIVVPCRNGFSCAAVMDLDPLGTPRVVASFSDADVRNLRWVNDDRLIYEAFKRMHIVGRGGGGTFAVNHDGTDERQLIAWVSDTLDVSNVSLPKMLPYSWSVYETFDDGSPDVLVRHQMFDGAGEPRGYQIARLDTVTGNRRSLNYGLPDRMRGWLLDGKREPRVVMTHEKSTNRVWWRGGASDWREVTDFQDFSEQAFGLWHLENDGKVLITARRAGDSEGLFKFDLGTGRVEAEPVVQVKGFDLHPYAVTDTQTNHLVGIELHTDRWQTYWFDEGLASVQRGVDAALPKGRVNLLHCGRCESSRFVVVSSVSDRQPGEYYLFDRAKSSLQRIGSERPWIDESTQGRRSFHRVAARDGLPLPVYVTRPATAARDEALPAVVLVHGGPWLRGSSLEWDAEAQFLASRGYLVLEPEFRGSEGYGWRLFHEGWKQWGRAMQQDLADTVQWAAQQGWIDKQRVCVMGGSYGGYAALMAPIVTPGVFRCAVSFAGVTDINLMYDVSWSDMSEEWRQYGMPVLIGDREKDRQMLAEASPLKRVAEIKIPLLVAQGVVDHRVPLIHESKFVSAARSAGVQVEEIIYPDEGHGFGNPDHYADYLRRVEAFLRKSLARDD
jgi:dienelactone hydrolase